MAPDFRNIPGKAIDADGRTVDLHEVISSESDEDEIIDGYEIFFEPPRQNIRLQPVNRLVCNFYCRHRFG